MRMTEKQLCTRLHKHKVIPRCADQPSKFWSNIFIRPTHSSDTPYVTLAESNEADTARMENTQTQNVELAVPFTQRLLYT